MDAQIEFRDPQKAFKNAIQKGVLKLSPPYSMDRETDYAQNVMYMHTLEGRDFFKNIVTRKYISCEVSL